MSSGARKFAWTLGLLLLSGCSYPVREQADLAVQSLSSHTVDLEPLLPPDRSRPEPRAEEAERPERQGDLQKRPRRPLYLPRDLPGANVPPIALPDPQDPQFEQKKEEAWNRLYPELPTLGSNPVPGPGPNGQPLTLADLQRLALSNSPLIRQAAADVAANKGAVIKAGAYPNPTIGYEEDTAGTAGGPGYQGAFIDQVIKTGGKLKLAAAAAQMDLLNSQLALRRAQTDLMAQVRSGYFAVLVAQENVRVNQSLVRFMDRIFRIQVILVKAGPAAPAAPYEPMQLRVLAYQARGGLIQARNRYVSAWKQLAATLGLPALPPTCLAGRADMPVPVFCYDKVLTRVLSQHTDVGTAENGIRRARYNLRAAQVTPFPDIEVRLAVQKDFTGPPFNVVHSLQVGGPIPIWDQNKGGIIQAQGQLLRAVEESHRVRDDLTTRLADAYERYDNNRRLLEYYRDRILPDQVRVYRGIYERHHQESEKVSFGDIVTAQQTLATAIATYLTTLGLQWQAVVDVASLLQTNDLFQVSEEAPERQCLAPVPDLDQLPPLPCCHPSSPLPDPHLKGADPVWPPAIPAEPAPPARPAAAAERSPAKGQPPVYLPRPEAVKQTMVTVNGADVLRQEGMATAPAGQQSPGIFAGRK